MKNFMHKDVLTRTIIAGFIYAAVFAVCGCILTGKVVFSAVFAVILTPYACREYRKRYLEKRKARTEKQFTEAMQLVLSAICAGKSPEQAFAELTESGSANTKAVLGGLFPELEKMNKRVLMNYSFYDELEDFAMRTGSADVVSVVHALKIVGIKGGNVPFVLRNALAGMRVKTETDDEIRQVLALPQYNHRIITIMPFALIFMIKSISPDYVSVLYNSKIGLVVVCAVSAVIFAAWLLGKRISDVRY